MPRQPRSIGHFRRAAGSGTRQALIADLVRMLPLWPAEIADDSSEGRLRLLQRLRRALRQERARGISGHWAYDLARHAQLLALYKALLADEIRDGRPGRDKGRSDAASTLGDGR